MVITRARPDAAFVTVDVWDEEDPLIPPWVSE